MPTAPHEPRPSVDPWRALLRAVIPAMIALIFACAPAARAVFAADAPAADASSEETRKRIDELEKKIDALTKQLADARATLACGDIPTLIAAISEPLTPQRFLINLTLAPRLTLLRIPVDPAEAKATLCR